MINFFRQPSPRRFHLDDSNLPDELQLPDNNSVHQRHIHEAYRHLGARRPRQVSHMSVTLLMIGVCILIMVTLWLLFFS